MSNIKKYLLNSDKFKNEVKNLYCSSNYELYADRYAELHTLHSTHYSEPDMFISSPGRIELLGNHTDHNNGKVLCASITVDTIGAITKRDDNKVEITSLGYPAFIVDLNDLNYNKDEEGTSDSLVKGIARYFLEKNAKVGGFTATTTSYVFKGAGVSSSAAFELLIAECFDVYYNNSSLSPMFKAQSSQYAENKYFGKPCGLMDQSAIALGGVSYIDFKDTANPIVQSHSWNWDNAISVVLINTGGDHCDLTEHYSSIRKDMEDVASYFGAKSLRYVDELAFKNSLMDLKNIFSGRAIMRALHFFNENKRVVETDYAITGNNLNAFLYNINKSGDSSYKLLQNCYPAGDITQNIPLALAIANELPGLKAARVHGGGFAGTILCFVENDSVDEFISKMSVYYGRENVFNIGIRNSGAREVKF